MKIIEHHQHRLLPRKTFNLPQQRLERLLLLALRRDIQRRSEIDRRQRVQVCDQRHVFHRRRGGREQRLQLSKPRRWPIRVPKTRRSLHLRDHRIERAVLMVRRAEIAQPSVRFGGDPLGQRLGEAGLADTRLGGNQHHPSVARLRLRPAAEQQLHFLVAADQRCGAGTQCLETALAVSLRPALAMPAPATGRPLSSTVPRSWHSNRPPICRRVAASITT